MFQKFFLLNGPTSRSRVGLVFCLRCSPLDNYEYTTFSEKVNSEI